VHARAAEVTTVRDKPTILFVCVHNAGRSQMAAAFAEEMSHGEVGVMSAGSEPADQLNPAVLEAMTEVGLDLSARTPRLLADEAVQSADVVITMGCGDACPIYPGKRYEDWELTDPAGQPVDIVRGIRDDIKNRVEKLLESL
jgi:arsenate reductase